MDRDFMQPSKRKYVGLAVVCTVFSALAIWWTSGGILLAAMFWGLVFFTPLVIDFVPHLFHHSRKQALRELQGKHYVFGRTPVRIYYSAGEVWIPTRDLYHALELPLAKSGLERLVEEQRASVIPNTKIQGLSESQLVSFLRYSRSAEKDRFQLWFERQVALPIHNKVKRGLPIVEQVD